MRTNINIKAICSICGNDLEADSGKSKMEFSSAQNATAKLAIKPCRGCYRKATLPVHLVKEALAMIEQGEE